MSRKIKYQGEKKAEFRKETCFFNPYTKRGDSLVAQMVKRLPAVQETRVQSLGREDPLAKEMATHSSTHAWKIPWMEKPGGLQSMESQSWTRLSDHSNFHFHTKRS